MKVLIIGGTGLLGSEAAAELIRRGHDVTAVALPPVPPGASLPKDMKLAFGNYMTMKDDELRSLLGGQDALVFAAGVDERVEGPAPIYDMFKRYNIDPLRRLLAIAQAVGVRHTVILGSYFAYFAKTLPKLRLATWHPYIRSRVDQETMALSFCGEGFDVAVLELPYIFGTQPGRKPVWMFLVQSIASMPAVTFYTSGGTTMVTVRQVAQAIAGAVERNRGGNVYPIGYYNMTWRQMLAIVHRHMGRPGRPIITIPEFMYALSMRSLRRKQRKNGIDGGLDMPRFARLQVSRLFIDKSLGSEKLGVQPDDIDAAIGDSVRLCMRILRHNVPTIGMKGE
ncbi:MAG: NAD(P)-dependent oxidoreductase [Bifidobacterium sp.]|jgi:nucleoside-diphosphate-sugar epimerase|nr:NAD(P)-dependent oxidoreductase [Bifidobacterium sp.]